MTFCQTNPNMLEIAPLLRTPAPANAEVNEEPE
jgi:hypothetical protein